MRYLPIGIFNPLSEMTRSVISYKHLNTYVRAVQWNNKFILDDKIRNELLLGDLATAGPLLRNNIVYISGLQEGDWIIYSADVQKMWSISDKDFRNLYSSFEIKGLLCVEAYRKALNVKAFILGAEDIRKFNSNPNHFKWFGEFLYDHYGHTRTNVGDYLVSDGYSCWIVEKECFDKLYREVQ